MKAIMRDEREMKDSGIEWLGKIPVDWNIHRIKNNYSILSGSGFKPALQGKSFGDYPVCKASDISNAGKILLKAANYIDKDDARSEHFNIIPANSIIFAKIGEALKKNNRSIVAVDCCVDNNCQAVVPMDVSPIYSYYLYSCLDMGWFDNGGAIPSLNNQKLRDLKIPYPNSNEQQRIANYLDDRCSKIDAIIAEAKASIEEYKELKQAVIYEAVTKGLDKNVEMKDSGVEWIGKTPLDWQIIRVKHLLTEVNNRSVQGLEEPLSVSQVLGIVPSSEISVANPTSSYIGQKVVEQHDMVFNRLKAHLGVFFESNYKGLVSPDYAVFRGNKRINPKFLEYLFHTPAAITEFKKYITGVGDGLRRLYTDDLFNISVSIPSIEIQNEIISTLNLKVQKIDVLVSEKQSLIEDLESYKKSLIYEVVTGKQKVVE